MAKRLSTGRNEVGMLSDLKEVAEEVGLEVLGFEIEWIVETNDKSTRKRPDVEVRRADGNRELLVSGEAKRPETVKGLHAFVESEVTDALDKAKRKGGRFAFTTNFLEIAFFDVDAYDGTDYLATVAGDRVALADEKETLVEDWWANLTQIRREALMRPGLTDFFRQLNVARTLNAPVTVAGKDEAYFTIFKSSTDAIVSDALPEFMDRLGRMALPQQVFDEAKDRDFDLTKTDVARYFVAQATAEILTSGLFYETVRPNFSLKPILKGTNPSTSQAMLNVFLENLDEAMRITGDYETIFTLSEGARFVLSIESDSLRALWLSLFSVLDGVKFAEINSEIIGVIFERLISTDRRQDMGQHYTQSRLARAMTRWGVQKANDHVVDFCAGGGTFLVEAYNELRQSKTHEEVLSQVFGNDLDSFAVQLSTVNLATRDVYKGHNFPAVSNRDAFDIRPGEPAVDVTPQNGAPYKLPFPDKFDVILGNPPYDEKADRPTRYRSDLASIAGGGGVSVLPSKMSDNVNLAAWFILLGAAWLSPKGRIALVLPASILQNEKHISLLRWARNKYDISVWHTESDVWFSDARVAPISLFMIPRGQAPGALGKFEFVNVKEPVSGEIINVAGFPRPAERNVVRDLSNLGAESDALIEGTIPDALREYEGAANAVRLGAASEVSVYSGNKLGHPFYKMRDREPTKTSDRRSLTAFDIQTTLSKKYLTPLLGAPGDAKTGEYNPNDIGYWVLSAPKTLPKGGQLDKYIRAVERAGALDSPSVRAKGKAWWHADWRRSRIAIGIHPQFQPQVWWSDDEFVSNNNFHVITVTRAVNPADQELIAASLASVFGALSALYRSSEVGVEGVRWLSTRNLLDWVALDWTLVSTTDKKAVLEAYRAYRKTTRAKIFEMTSSAVAVWRELNVAVARAAGITGPEQLADEAFAEANSTTLRRRKREMQATTGRTRSGSTGAGKLLRDITGYIEAHAEFLPVVEALTEGDDVMRLHVQEAPEALFDIANESEQIRIGNELAEILGGGFRAAPVWEDATVDQLRRVDFAVLGQFVQLDTSGDVMPGYELIATSVREQLQKTLGKAVKKRLT
ncbi:N-6 DNA methylase [Brevibacterium sp. CBA3109]|uniref:N-6 DNA methylase n=1 Tax=Brevibacterium koreense TaxID=3140787 RepID=A0AAU7UHD9_9MICO